ncbi:MAG: dipeptidase [Bacteroidota bacterium]
MQATQAFIQANKDRFLEELQVLLRIPSVSADPAFEKEVHACAGQVAEYMVHAGLEQVQIIPTEGYPIVYAEKILDPALPTVLIYGHYDVQPPDPIDLWHTEPFDPVIITNELHPDGAVVARGSADDKGQFFMHIKAVEAMVASNELPCNVKVMIEGEEEVGSANLGNFLRANQEMLAADVILISDTSMLSLDNPSITVGLRGLSYVEVKVQGPNRDLHSGVYGGAVANPVNVLSKMIASLIDDNGHITIPGFYDDVEELSEEERAAINAAPFDLREYKKELDIDEVQGEAGYTTVERKGIRPTLDVNGIWGGYTGEGAKTVLPAEAHAKISMRLVPNQDPNKITELFQQHFEAIAPKSVRVSVAPHHGGQPYVTPINSEEYRAAHLAVEATFGKAPIPTRDGGSIPITALFEEVLGLKSILMGFGLDSDGLHSPNEHYGLRNFYKGIETIPHFFQNYAELKRQ